MKRSISERELATYAWYGLLGYICAVDIALLVSGKKTMTEVWEDGLRHSWARRAALFGVGFFTVKHLYKRDFIPWLDPYGAIAGGAMLIKRASKRGVPNGYASNQLAGIDSIAIVGSLGNEGSHEPSC